ncbi:MAG: MBL fold metallo-hydrolase [Eggerthellaceae bacterium]|nr:MBL fold metallo-hydrolase [Eggerthellaceae bacterium]
MNEKATLTYLGHSSLKLITPEGCVAYIDPYAGDDYAEPADAILITHEHFDHNNLEKVINRASTCRIVRSADAINGSFHNDFDLGWMYIHPVEAGYNAFHDVSECVGYILTLSNGKKIYVSGDTSITEQMRTGALAREHIDYAFWCCDGDYNMDIPEAIEASRLVKAQHNIPYHIVSTDTGRIFDLRRAQAFIAPGALIIQPSETIEL